MVHVWESKKQSVRTQPGKVDGDLLAEVLSDVVERLVLVPLAPRRPVVEEDLPVVQLLLGATLAGVLEGALQVGGYSTSKGGFKQLTHFVDVI